MRSKGRSAAWLILLWTASSCLLIAQSRPNPQSAQGTNRKTSFSPAKFPATQLLDSDQGLAILGAALETKHPGRAGADCSHLVHAIYEKAGFPYAYAPSADLYAGTDQFRRVTQPQAGDLVVWLGHAGVVVNPGQHTFYSALRSGLGVQAYDSKYWKRRGRPHFLRYIRETEPILTASNRGPSLKPTGLRNGGSRESILSETGTRVHDSSGRDADPDVTSEELTATIPTVPSIVNVHSGRPKADQVRTALLEEFQQAAGALIEQDVLKVYPSLVAFKQFEVKKVQIKGDQGWAEIHIQQPSAISSTAARPKKYPKVQRWSLHRRTADNWELALPSDAIYLPREAAVRLMAHQLAVLTDADSLSRGNPEDKVRLARLLNVLLAEPSTR